MMIFDLSIKLKPYKMKVMKKNLFMLLTAVVTFTSFSYAANSGPDDPATVKMDFTKKFTSLDIKDHVNIILTSSSESGITIRGDQQDVKDVRAGVNSGRLTVWMTGSGRGAHVTVYVPAALLDQIFINGDSKVQTESILSNPQLDVEINGECRISIRSLGKVDVRNGSEYEFKKE
jgi:hypothetical protein